MNNAETFSSRGEPIPMPVNYFWSTNDPDLPFTGSGLGNIFAFPPSNATRTPVPTEVPNGTHPCWDYMNEQWVFKQDYRRIALWDKATGQAVVCSTIACQPTMTDREPRTRFDFWDDKKNDWVTDTAKQEATAVSELQRQRGQEILLANSQIDQLNDIITYLDASESKPFVTLLSQWRMYRTKLNILKITSSSVVLPKRPTLIEDLEW